MKLRNGGNEHTQMVHLIESYRTENQCCHTGYYPLLPKVAAKRYAVGMATVERPTTEVGQMGKGFRQEAGIRLSSSPI